jgi:hypothetical protein
VTLDELIKELNEIKKRKGGDINVYFADHNGITEFIDVTYSDGDELVNKGVFLS